MLLQPAPFFLEKLIFKREHLCLTTTPHNSVFCLSGEGHYISLEIVNIPNTAPPSDWSDQTRRGQQVLEQVWV